MGSVCGDALYPVLEIVKSLPQRRGCLRQRKTEVELIEAVEQDRVHCMAYAVPDADPAAGGGFALFVQCSL